MQNQQNQENYESSPRNRTIEQINNEYQRSKQDIEQFNSQNVVDKQAVRNSKYQSCLEQYNENYQIKIGRLKTSLIELENDIKMEIEKEKKVFNIENQESINYLKEIQEQYKEIEKLENAVKSSSSTNNLANTVQKGTCQKILKELESLDQQTDEKNQEKMQFQLNLEDVGEQPQNNVEYYQRLEKQVSQIEKILGIDGDNDVQSIKINNRLKQNLVDLEGIELDETKVQRMKEVNDEIEELQKKKEEIQFRNKDLQMIEDIWQNYQNYQTVQNHILPIKQRLEMLKKIHEESDSISKTISNLNQVNQDLDKNVKKVKTDLEKQQKEYLKEFGNIEQEMCKIEKIMKI